MFMGNLYSNKSLSNVVCGVAEDERQLAKASGVDLRGKKASGIRQLFKMGV
jgi:hypothetical protein